MPVKMKPIRVIEMDLGLGDNGIVNSFIVNTCYKHMTKYVPKDEGNLRTIVDITPNSITYESPYARYQYYGMREDGTHKVRHYTTPGTGTYWDKRMVSADMKKITREVQKKFFGG